jgi:hypothetical protein
MTKRCVKCNRDVTNDKRMKDSKGQYWCYDCGAQDEAGRGSGLIQKCPSCGNPTHAAKFLRIKDKYVCESCAEGGGKTKKGGGTEMGSGADQAKKDKIKVVVGAACLVGGLALILWNMGMFG